MICLLKSPFWCSVQFSSVAQLCLTLCDPMNCSTPGLLVHHQLPESTKTHVHQVDDATQPCHPLLSSFPLALNLSHHQGLFQWVSSSHQVAKWTPWTVWKGKKAKTYSAWYKKADFFVFEKEFANLLTFSCRYFLLSPVYVFARWLA